MTPAVKQDWLLTNYCVKTMYFGFKTYLHICSGHEPFATTEIPTLMLYPMVPFRTYIKRACNPKPGTGKHVNANNQLEEELDYANFSYTRSKHKKHKTSYEFRVGSLVVCYLSIIPLAHVGHQMIISNEARMIILLKTPPKYTT